MQEMPNNMQGMADLPHILYEHGVRTAVICPGSRNAPIVNALVSYGKFDCISLVDERSAAYFALGMAQQTQTPVVINCTSGTAVLNLAPALTEAYYMGIPLVAITADRPPEWIDQADGQAIRQNGIFANHIKYQVTLPVQTIHRDDLWFFHNKTSEALNHCQTGKPGPVHINIPLREPLYETLPQPSLQIKIHQCPNSNILHHGMENFIKDWSACSKRMILVGMKHPDHGLQKSIEKIVGGQQAVVVAENISNLCHQGILDTPEAFFASIGATKAEAFVPEIFVTLGDALVSKKMKLFLRQAPSLVHWHFDADGAPIDTFQALSQAFPSDGKEFLNAVCASGNDRCKTYFRQCATRKDKVKNAISGYLATVPFSDLYAVQKTLETIPGGYDVHLSNSSAVRLAQMLITRKDLRYFSNRGTSGIDGSVSTAMGGCYASKKYTLLICGDLSFIYDSNALWNGKMPANLKIMVLNNQGGNIFQMIKTGTTYPLISPFLETPHNIDLGKLTGAFGVEYFFANGISNFSENLEGFLNHASPAVFEIRTQSLENTKVFKGLYEQLSKMDD
jgi:2-succinyl-5-enolpyruvyl-6-hydroxy-3-cyclohexene-1-carboxylate synthase